MSEPFDLKETAADIVMRAASTRLEGRDVAFEQAVIRHVTRYTNSLETLARALFNASQMLEKAAYLTLEEWQAWQVAEQQRLEQLVAGQT